MGCLESGLLSIQVDSIASAIGKLSEVVAAACTDVHYVCADAEACADSLAVNVTGSGLVGTGLRCRFSFGEEHTPEGTSATVRATIDVGRTASAMRCIAPSQASRLADNALGLTFDVDVSSNGGASYTLLKASRTQRALYRALHRALRRAMHQAVHSARRMMHKTFQANYTVSSCLYFSLLPATHLLLTYYSRTTYSVLAHHSLTTHLLLTYYSLTTRATIPASSYFALCPRHPRHRHRHRRWGQRRSRRPRSHRRLRRSSSNPPPFWTAKMAMWSAARPTKPRRALLAKWLRHSAARRVKIKQAAADTQLAPTR